MTHELEPGETIFSKGDADDRYFVVLEGEVEIRAGGELRRVLAPGDDFGEIAVLHRVPRTASAVGRGSAQVISLNGARMREVVGGARDAPARA